MEHPFSADNPPRPYMLSTQALHQSYPAQSPPQSQPSYQQYHPVSISHKPAHATTFVHKLYNMVIDTQFQHLIAWNYTGSSFIVCNIMEFAKEVLPKHFKHNNFSSFVRQLNMYGFHKVNKSPRGHRTLAENQIWEFSHQKFLRDQPDLLDDIKRKAMENDNTRREAGDLHAHLAMMQVSQSDMLQQLNHLYDSFNQIIKELEETKQKQESCNKLVKTMMDYLTQQNGGQLPDELNKEYENIESTTSALDISRNNINKSNSSNNINSNNRSDAPSIFVTSHNHYHSTPSSSNSTSNTSANMNNSSSNVNNSTSLTDSILHRMYSNTNQGQLLSQQPLVPTQSKNTSNRSISANNRMAFGATLSLSPGSSILLSDKEGFFANNNNSSNNSSNSTHQLPTSPLNEPSTSQVFAYDGNYRINPPIPTSPAPLQSQSRQPQSPYSFMEQRNTKSNR